MTETSPFFVRLQRVGGGEMPTERRKRGILPELPSLKVFPLSEVVCLRYGKKRADFQVGIRVVPRTARSSLCF